MTSPASSPAFSPASAASAPLLRVRNLVKRFPGNARPAVDNVSFDLTEGDLLGLLGESGSGKTTLLRMLAGLEAPDGGTIELDGRVVSDGCRVVPPERRGIGFVFQHHALFPHLTVRENIAFGLRGRPRAEIDEAVQTLLELVGLPGFGARYPHELSGGERQRIALARSLAPRPRLILLDEPFSSLDTGLRQTMRDETRAILRARGTTAVFVTHDTADALSVADAVAVLRHGALRQLDTPRGVYRAPVARDVACFLGPCEFLPRTALRHEAAFEACRIGPPARHDDGCVWVRPQDLRLVDADDPTAALHGTVRLLHYEGSHLEAVLRCDTGGADGHTDVRVWLTGGSREGETVSVGERYGIRPR